MSQLPPASGHEHVKPLESIVTNMNKTHKDTISQKLERSKGQE